MLPNFSEWRHGVGGQDMLGMTQGNHNEFNTPAFAVRGLTGLAISLLVVALLPQVAQAVSISDWRWDTLGNLNGWAAGTNTSVAAAGGNLVVTVNNGSDPCVNPATASVNANDDHYLVMDLIYNPTGAADPGDFQLFFWSPARGGAYAVISEPCSIHFSVPKSASLQRVVVDMAAANAQWNGTITNFRLDLGDNADAGQTISLNYYGFVNKSVGKYDAIAYPNTQPGEALTVSSGALTFNTDTLLMTGSATATGGIDGGIAVFPFSSVSVEIGRAHV